MKSKIIVAGLVGILFLGFSSIGSSEVSKSILFVGGAGAGNYSSIQDAVNDASNGDTIIVHNGIYYENLVLNKSITIVGEDRINTIVDGNGSGDTVIISADNVCIRNFTIKNKGASGTGINIKANQSVISENLIIDNNWSGIEAGSAFRNCTVSENTIMNNGYGIFFGKKTTNINFSTNDIGNNSLDGIYLDQSSDGIVTDNIIDKNGDDGLSLTFSNGIFVYKNFIINSIDNGIYMYSSTVVINENIIAGSTEGGIFLRNSNESQIVWNNIVENGKGIEATFLSCNNVINNNNITSNGIGIYSSADAGSNDFSGNSFSNNNVDVQKESAKTPGFEIIFVILSMAFVILFKREIHH
jgi:nitrous oxidase accessory protein